MWSGPQRLWARIQRWRDRQRRSSPAFIAALAREVAHLAELAERAGFSEQHTTPLRLLREEMEALSVIAPGAEFARLSEDRRLSLSERLERTRRFLISTMQDGTPPTERVQ